MPKSSNHTFSHVRHILGRQPAIIKSVYPGMIIQFRYKKGTMNDPKPLVLCLWNEIRFGNLAGPTPDLIHGINLNYLTDYRVETLFEQLD
jgi:hypothetical protein